MAKNCLVTKLKGAVNNDNLHRLGMIKFIIPANSQGRNGIIGNGDAVLEGNPSQVYFSDSTYTQNLGQSAKVGVSMYIVNNSNSDAILWVTDYYSITKIFDWSHQDNITFDTNDDGYWLEYLSSSLTEFAVGSGKSIYNINVDNLKEKTALTNITVRLGGKCHLENLANLTNLVTLILPIDSDVSGNISSFAHMTSLTRVDTTWSNSVFGSVEDLFENLLSNGKDGNLVFDFHNTKVTLNNNLLQNIRYTAVFDHSNGTIVINDNNSTQVASYNGSTWTYA